MIAGQYQTIGSVAPFPQLPSVKLSIPNIGAASICRRAHWSLQRFKCSPRVFTILQFWIIR